MTHLDLTDDEAVLVREILETKAEGLLVEIRHTTHREFRDMLKARAAQLDQVIARLPKPLAKD